MTSERREILLVEYQKAQDSAEHHDDLAWSVTSLSWVGSAVLIGFILAGLSGSHPARQRTILILLCTAGLLLTILVTWWAMQGHAYRRDKYSRCREIEELLGMEQHLRVVRRPLPLWRRPWQKFGYLLFAGVFVAVWCTLLSYSAGL